MGAALSTAREEFEQSKHCADTLRDAAGYYVDMDTEINWGIFRRAFEQARREEA